MMGDLWVLKRTSYPFQSFVLDTSLRRVGSLVPDFSRLAKVQHDLIMSSWRGLPLFRLARGYSQLISDPRSSKRQIHVFDEHGRWLRMRTIDAPIGLFHSDDGVHVLGVRRLKSLELVVYHTR